MQTQYKKEKWFDFHSLPGVMFSLHLSCWVWELMRLSFSFNSLLNHFACNTCTTFKATPKKRGRKKKQETLFVGVKKG
jgi:hypothetical protein